MIPAIVNRFEFCAFDDCIRREKNEEMLRMLVKRTVSCHIALKDCITGENDKE